MKKIINIFTILGLVTLFTSANIYAQEVYQLVPSKSSLTIKGTSSLHDWSMKAKNLSCNLKTDVENMNVQRISNVDFSCHVDQIVSDESGIMDSKAHNALKGDKFPVISFKFLSESALDGANQQFKGTITGNLTIAGKTKTVSVPFSGSLQPNGDILVKGTIPVKMSEFSIDPPTAFFGTLKTGDVVNLQYSFEFSK